MNAIPRLPLLPSLVPQANLLELRRRQLAAREKHQLASDHITVLWTPAAATPEERIAIATLLLADTGFTISPTEPTS
jgi:hypothetical protein